MTAKKVARAAVAVLKTRKTIMPAKNTASSIMLAKKLILSYSPIRQLKNRNCFYPMPSSARKAYRAQNRRFGYYPALTDKHALAEHLKLRLTSRPLSPYCRTPSNSRS